MIFETKDITKQWDGQYKKNTTACGVYIYYTEMENPGGKRITKRGVVTLIR